MINMDLFDFPDKDLWLKRCDLIGNEIEQSMTGYSYMASDHATALFMDLQTCYCAGAWISVIVLSVSVIDSHLRETEALDTSVGTAKLLDEYFEGSDINWLRRLRNKYVHVDVDNPILEMNSHFNNQKEMEEDATKAIKMVISALFQSPGT
jgi:hypothetical protein